MRNIQCQSNAVTMKPPTTGPRANPIYEPMVTIVRPVASFSGGIWLVQHMGAEAAMAAAPIPWTALEAIITGKDSEIPQAKDPMVKSVSPEAKTFLTPLSAYMRARGIRSEARTRK